MIRKEFVYVFICLLFLLPNEVMAGSFTVHPIKVFVEPEKKTATLIVTNNGEEVVAIQVEGIVWRQDEGGKDTFEPTQDIIFFPKIFSVGPKEERVVRIGYNGQWPVTEKTYRLFLRELPVSKPGETALKMALRIGVPVFISPSDKTEEMEIEKVAIEERQPAENRKAEPEETEKGNEVESSERNLVVKVRNTGNTHFSVKKIKATSIDDSGVEIFRREIAGWYVLPGVCRPFIVEVPIEDYPESKVIKVEVEGEKTHLYAELDVDSALCSK